MSEWSFNHPFLDLSTEVVALFHVLRARTEDLHRDLGMSAGERGLLFDLWRNGPQTVPALARKRQMSRQNIQAIVDRLREREFVEPQANREHRRSVLISPSGHGYRLAEKMLRDEERLIRTLKLPSRARLNEALTILEEVRRTLEAK